MWGLGRSGVSFLKIAENEKVRKFATYILMNMSYVSYMYLWHLLICFVHRGYEGRACTHNLIFGIAAGHSLVPLLSSSLPIEARHAQSEATRFVTAT